MILIETNDTTIRIDANNINVDAPSGAIKQEAAQTPTLVNSSKSGGGSVSKTIRGMAQSLANLPGEHLFASFEPPLCDLSQNAALAICAKDVMQKEVVWAEPDDSVEQALAKMQQTDSGYLLVGTDGLIEGILSKSDLAGAVSPYLQHPFAKWRRPLDDATLQIRIKWIMSRPVRTVKPETLLAVIMENMCRFGGRCLPVVDRRGKVQGLVTVSDIFRALENTKTAANEALQQEITEQEQAEAFLRQQSVEQPAADKQPEIQITEDEPLEEALRHLAGFAEQETEAIAAIDLDRTLRYANPAWASMHGYGSKHELTGKHISEFHTKEQMKIDVIPFIEEAKCRGRLTGPIEHLRSDGTVFPTQTKMTIMKDQEGKATGLVIFVTEVAEHKQTERRLIDQTTELTDADEQRLQQEITERKQAEERLRQQADELTAANERLQQEIAERKQLEEESEQYRDQLEHRTEEQAADSAAANEKLQHEIIQRRQVEERLEQCADELTVVNELLQQQISEREQTENELQQYRDRLEQRLQEQTAELVAVNEKLKQEIALRMQAEKALRKIKLRLLTLTQGRSIASVGCARSRPVLPSNQVDPTPVPALS